MRRRGHSEGAIDERGPNRWRLRWRVGDQRFSKTIRGPKKAAQAELRRLLESADRGMHVVPDRTTVADYLRGWLDSEVNIARKTAERYRQLVQQQIVPHLGAVPLQALRPSQIQEWHGTLLRQGGARGRPLSARTVGHAHRVLRRGLERAVELEIIVRNAAASVRPPKVEAAEVAILTPEQITDVLARLTDHPLHPIVSFALGSGMRRGEICALQWGDIDLDAATVRVERSLEETAEGLRVKAPKTRHGRRVVSLPANLVEIMRAHWRAQTELRLKFALGRPAPADPVFPLLPEFDLYHPDKLSRDWGNVVRDRKMPRIMFHALRHSHASALIAAGLDVVTVSRRLGHGSPAITLGVYAHAFGATDRTAAQAIDAVMR